MQIELKQAISYAEKDGWNLENFNDHSALVSREKDQHWKRKFNILKQFPKIKLEVQRHDYRVFVLLWDSLE